jgi:proline racemase
MLAKDAGPKIRRVELMYPSTRSSAGMAMIIFIRSTPRPNPVDGRISHQLLRSSAALLS